MCARIREREISLSSFVADYLKTSKTERFVFILDSTEMFDLIFLNKYTRRAGNCFVPDPIAWENGILNLNLACRRTISRHLLRIFLPI